MFIRKLSQALFRVVPNRDFFDTELPEELTAQQAAEIVRLQTALANVEGYLEKVYYMKRQGASTREVEIPECLKVEIEAAVEQQKEPDIAVPLSKKSRKPQKLPGPDLNTSPKTP